MTRATSMLEDAEVMCHDNVLRKRGVRVNASYILTKSYSLPHLGNLYDAGIA